MWSSVRLPREFIIGMLYFAARSRAGPTSSSCVFLVELGVELRGFEPLTYSMRTSRVGLTWEFVAGSCDGCATSPQVSGVGCDGRRKSAQTWRGFPARFLRDSGPRRPGQQTRCWDGAIPTSDQRAWRGTVVVPSLR